MTIEEYSSLSAWKRFGYRLYRNPLVMFGLGPAFLFLIGYRLIRKDSRRQERNNTYLTNSALVLLIGLLCWTLGWKQFLIVQGSILYLSGVVGIWLFYVQHQFEGTYFERSVEWEYQSAALQGSSYYQLPKFLQWMTGNIGFHHIHHLDPKVPNYHLQKTHESISANQDVPVIRFFQSLQSLRYKFWDESGKRFVGFRELKR